MFYQAFYFQLNLIKMKLKWVNVSGHQEPGIADDHQGRWKYVHHEGGSGGESWPGSSLSMSTATWGNLSQHIRDSLLLPHRGGLHGAFWEEMSDHF